MKLVNRIGDYRIYALDERECKQHHKPYPCYVCWEEKLGTTNRDIGNLSLTENESDTLQDMVDWCKDNSY